MIERLKSAWLAFCRPELLDVKDPLTGALTPREFRRLAGRTINRSQKGGELLSLVLIDSDGLKKINDTHGHSAGDAFLKKLAEAIFVNIRPFDICSRRYGEGCDEFILLLPGADSIAAKKVAERINQSFSQFSWGATTLGPEDVLEDMVARAEKEMYKQKMQKSL